MEIKLDRDEFINQYPPFNLINSKDVTGVFEKEEIHLYVHLPFCKSKCEYCYFKSYDEFDDETVESYLKALKMEISKYSKMPEVQSKRIKSLYFGGGTPTLLSVKQLEDLTVHILGSFDFKENFEFCVEANPDKETATREKFELLMKLNVKRVSFGVQNFNEKVLRLNGRLNKLDEFYEIFDMAKSVGIDIRNVDIMSGMFGETDENWRSNIDKLIELAPENIAFYKIELYYNTKLFEKTRNKDPKAMLMTNDKEIEHIRYAFDRLQDEGNYTVTNCFNLSKGRENEHLHRKGIWEGDDMLGVGLSSHSCFNQNLYQNTWNMKDYIKTVESQKLPIKRAYPISMRDEIASAMVYGIKSLEMNREHFVNRFGFDFTEIYGETIRSLEDKGLLKLTTEALIVPREYYIFADDISRKFFLPEHETMMLAHLSRA
jgi:oxygen-independent coproporphyrinogen-3 oxidase